MKRVNPLSCIAKQPTFLRSEGGFMSADFLISMVISALVCMMLAAMATTYTVIEISQYIAFSAARAHAAANEDYQVQQDLARRKFSSLLNNKVLAPLFKNDWFDLTLEDVRSGIKSDGKNFADDYPVTTVPVPQVGVRLELNAKILNMRLGPLGSSDDGSGQGFKTKVTGFLIREPNWNECWEQMKAVRYDTILRLDRRYDAIAGKVKSKSYLAMEDNGC